MIFLALMFLLPAAFGAAILATAKVGVRLLGMSHWFAKLVAVLISYAAWVGLIITGYALLGGDPGLMDGFGAILVVCFWSLISSLVFMLIWILAYPHNPTR